MSIDEFLGRLKGVRESGDGSWVACCPAHDDSNPSMSVTARNGKILLHCHAGCQASEIVAAMGLEMKDLFEDDSRGGGRVPRPKGARSSGKPPDVPSTASADATSKKKSGGHGRLVCDYIYRDEGGRALFKVERRVMPNGKKTFIAYHADSSAKGGWAFGIHDRSGGGDKLLVPFVAPYHLPALVTAAQAGRSLVIVEGEKDVETVERIGLVATCNPFGAGKWGNDWPADWAKWFVGLKSILIVADKDPETREVKVRGKVVQKQFLAGQKHAWDVYRKIQAAGVKAPVRLMCMPDVAGTKVKDFTDWVEARHAAKLSADKTALAAAMLEFGEWPAAWHFTDEEMAEVSAIARAEKSARDTSSDGPAEEGEDVARAEKSARDAASSEKGRFGRLRPRAPGKDEDAWEVDFVVESNAVVALTLYKSADFWALFGYAYGQLSRQFPKLVTSATVARLQAWVALSYLLLHGRFFWHKDDRAFRSCMYLSDKDGDERLLLIESDEFVAYVSRLANLESVDTKKGNLARIMGLVRLVAISDDYSMGVRPSVMWDRRGDAVYISSGDVKMYRIRGGKVEQVKNGTDGVVFLRGKTLAEWNYMPGAGVDPFAEALIFKNASWADVKNGPIVMRAWVLNMFSNGRTKPPLLLTGEAGSGKTRMAKAVKELMGTRMDGAKDLSVQQLEDGDKGQDAFWATVHGGRLEVFDNLDTKIKWASDALQIAATDGQTKRRTLYTTSGVSILKANAFLIFTSNNPIFSTEGNGGMADRLVTVRLLRNRHKSMDSELSADIETRRDAYMTWIADVLAKVGMDTEPVKDTVNSRHPDFGEFAIRCGRALGQETEFVEALGVVEIDKLLLPLQNDSIAREILAQLQVKGFVWRFTAADLGKAIVARLGLEEDDKVAAMYSSRKIGKCLGRYDRQFGSLIKFKAPSIIDGIRVYEATGARTQWLGASGLVDLNSGFGKSPIEGEGDLGLFQNDGAKHTNPLHARAPAPAPSFVKEKEEEESKGDEPFGPEGFEL